MFSYIVIQGNTCKVVKAVTEPGVHKMIMKWTWNECEPINIVPNTTYRICDLDLRSGDKDYDMCGVDSFVCKSGTCLASTSRCDGHIDCISGEDELNCIYPVHIGSYVCRDGKIITADRRCDLINDCLDGGDELNCFTASKECHKNFRCSSGHFVNLQYVCDGFFNCVDHSDEKACSESYNVGFLCNDISYVLQSVKNDLIPDCKDMSDEPLYQLLLDAKIDRQYRCPQTGAMIPCEMGHTRCFQLTHLCVLEYNIHNKITPCRNGAHLKHCQYFPCTGSFKCPESYCVPMRYVCNGRLDCPNGEDESGCMAGQMECPGSLRCKDGGCVPPSKICDGIVHCPHGDDERCIINCPPGCICKGLVLSCTVLNGRLSLQTKPVHLHIQRSDQKALELVFTDSLSDLQVLDVSNNSLSAIPKEISIFSQLIHLDLSNNLVTGISPDAFIALTSLSILRVIGNRINSISDNAFQGLSTLPF